MWCFELASAAWFGFELVTRLGYGRLDSLQCLMCGIPLGFIMQSWFFFFTTYIFGAVPMVGAVVSVLFCLFALVIRKSYKTAHPNFIFYLKPEQFWTYLVCGAYFFILYYSTMFYDNKWTKGAGYSDLPFHGNIINSFVMGINSQRNHIFNISFLIYAGEKLAYPFIPNFYSATLMSTGTTCIRYSVFIPSLFVSFSLMISLYSLAFWFSKRHSVAVMSIFLFCNLGGLAWRHMFEHRQGNDWIHMWNKDQEEYWFHPLNHIIIPQRASLWSIPLCCWSMLLLMMGVQYKEKRLMLLAALLTGAMPQVQIHSFVSIAQWAILYCLVHFEFSWDYVWLWAVYGVVANVLALPQVIPYLGRVEKSGEFLLFKPIWIGPYVTKNFPVLWWRGLGVFAAIAIAAGWFTATKRQIKIYIPSFIVFLIANFIRYQPWELDNTKIFYAVWIPLALPFVANYLMKLTTRPAGIMIMGLLVLAAVLSSLLNMWDTFFFPCPMYNNDDYKFGLWIAENTPLKSIFVSHGYPNDPVASLGGRQLFLGYPGWVDSHGLQYRERWQIIDYIVANPNDRRPMDKYGIEYVVDCVYAKRRTFLNNTSPEIWRRVYESPIYNVWRIVR